jgi:cysteine-rich repeat protein
LLLRGLVRRSVFLAPGSLALAVALAMASGARAENLLGVTSLRAGSLPPGVGRGRTLTLGRAALGDLRSRTSAVVAGFPLGRDATVALTLRRFEPFAPAARVEVVEDGRVRELPLPDQVYFAGSVSGDPQSRVLLVAGRDSVHGFVVARGTVYPFGPDGAGRHRSYALRDADPAVYPPPGDFCANDLHPAKLDSPLVSERAREEAGLVAPAFPRAASTTLLEVEVAVETDYELRSKFASNQQTLDYLASLVAASNTIYERDVNVRLRFSYIRLWASPGDPWSATTTSAQLDEVQAYWTDPAHDMNAIAGPHDIVHFISGKSVQGGIAYIGGVCNPTFQFGVSQVYGSFDLSNPQQIWDVLVVTHEIGHNLGTQHTHCYSPPLDRCYNQEPSTAYYTCYSGPVVSSRGTIMSYCHLLPPGYSNIDLVFGDVVSATIRTTVEGASCLGPAGTCGNGTLEGGEDCDDGNTIAGDGCSPACRFEVCGNGIVDPGEECDDGNTTDGDGCSATCQREPRCGDGFLDPGEECDDGNTTAGDGCSASCNLEPCKVVRSGQTIWVRAHMMVQHGASGRDRLALRADFSIPMAVGSLTPGATGMELMLDDGAGQRKVHVTLPPGPRWVTRRGRWIYKDRTGSVAGIRRLQVLDRSRGGVPEVVVTVSGQRAPYPVTSGDLPVAVTILLGDSASGLAGACGRHAFDAAACLSSRGGTRLVCR